VFGWYSIADQMNRQAGLQNAFLHGINVQIANRKVEAGLPGMLRLKA
jgi:hypothetical protein